MNSQDTSINETVSSGDETQLRALVANGVDVNQANKGGQTPLIVAVVAGHLRLVPILLDAGADPLLRDSTGLNAIQWADRKGLPYVAKLLTDRSSPGPHLDTEATNRWTRDKARTELSQVDKANHTSRDTVPSQPITSDEKSRRWIAGMKQRLDEKASRLQQAQTEGTSDGPPAEEVSEAAADNVRHSNEPVVQTKAVEIPQPLSSGSEAPVEAWVKPDTRVPTERADTPVISEHSTAVGSASVLTEQSAAAVTADAFPRQSTANVDTVPVQELVKTRADDRRTSKSSGRKRCPQCNTIYNSDLLAYCAYHIVPLVAIDAPPQVEPESNKRTWVLIGLVVATFLAASLAAYLLFRPVNEENKRISVPPGSPVGPTNQQGIPTIGRELRGKVIDVPAAETFAKLEGGPINVVVRIRVDKTGHVYWAQSRESDEQLRTAAVEAAKKATFSPARMRGRGMESTITFTFNP